MERMSDGERSELWDLWEAGWCCGHSLRADLLLPRGEMRRLVPQSFSAGIEFPLPRIEPGCSLLHLARDLLGKDVTRVAPVARIAGSSYQSSRPQSRTAQTISSGRALSAQTTIRDRPGIECNRPAPTRNASYARPGVHSGPIDEPLCPRRNSRLPGDSRGGRYRDRTCDLCRVKVTGRLVAPAQEQAPS